MYPLKLSYVSKSYIWGGRRLSEIYGKRIPGDADKISETWELSVRNGEMCTIENGPEAGRTLGNYIAAHPDAVSPDHDGGKFPLLIKFIDAADRLSVQVHPDDEYAARVENDKGKTEMWYVIDACPGAQLVYGLAPGVGADDFSAAVRRGDDFAGMLNYIDVRAGDWFFIPSGMLHAIGKGILIAEVQQNSDLTYRVYDYGRLGADGKLRQLHTEKAADVIRAVVPGSRERGSVPAEKQGTAEYPMVSCGYFSVSLLTVGKTTDRLAFRCGRESFISLLCTEGEGRLQAGGEEYVIRAGDSWFLPAGLGTCVLSGKMRLVRSSL